MVAKDYLSFARVLARSFRQHHPAVPFLVLLADEIDGYFDPLQEPFDLIELADLGFARRYTAKGSATAAPGRTRMASLITVCLCQTLRAISI